MSRGSEEARRWEIRKMKTAGVEVEEVYSDDESSIPDLVYVNLLPPFLDEKCSTVLKNDIMVERPNTEIGAIAKSKSVFLSTHPQSNKETVIEGQLDVISTGALPIHRFRNELMRFIGTHQVMVVVGETGCGKSTQIPQYLYQDGYGSRGLIGCTQPRRVAAVSLSNSLQSILGNKVAYSVRFDDTTTSETVIKYMTEGIILQELADDPLLSRYSVLILDEAHERSINLDVSMSLLKGVLKKRKELKLIIMSATIQTGKFCEFFGCELFSIEGKSYPVSIEYLKVNVDDYVEWAVKRVMHVHNNCGDGDILVFASGREDVEGIVGIVKYIDESAQPSEEAEHGKPILKVLPLYSQLPTEKQNEAFKRETGVRKCIVATNIAETSLTIPNIRYVVDCGLHKTSLYNYNFGESLITIPISKANADQRAGRAGRTRPGVCYRMYTKETYDNELLCSAVPEIQRVNVCNVVLMLLRLNVPDILKFDFIDSPSPDSIRSALLLLYWLDAVDSRGSLTNAGKIMSELKLDPPLAKMVLESVRHGCMDEILSIASMLSVENVFYRDFDKTSAVCHQNCDFLTFLNIFNEFTRQSNRKEWSDGMKLNSIALEKAAEVKKIAIMVLTGRGIEVSRSKSTKTIQKCILSSLYYNVAKRRNMDFMCLSNFTTCKIHPSSVLKDVNGYVVFYKCVITKKEYIYCCSVVDPQMILEEVGKYYRDRSGRRVEVLKQCGGSANEGIDSCVIEHNWEGHHSLEKRTRRSDIICRIDPIENLYDRFEKWDELDDSEEDEPIRRSRRIKF